jgi:hypothetical protein
MQTDTEMQLFVQASYIRRAGRNQETGLDSKRNVNGEKAHKTLNMSITLLVTVKMKKKWFTLSIQR